MPKKHQKQINPEELTEDDLFLERCRIVYEAINSRKMIEKQSELYQFMHALTDEVVPFESCCPHHQTPWQMIWDSYKVDLDEFKGQGGPDIIAVGPREGFKTLSTAKLNALEVLLKHKVEISSIGAIIKQASRCYKFTSKYLFHPVLSEIGLVLKNTMEETILATGSRYEQLVATVTGVNSPHPQKLRADEVELMKPDVVEEMKMIPSSYNNWRAHTLFTSTRKYVDGVMSELIRKSKREGRNSKTIVWCYKDVSEPCPDERSGINPKTYEVEDIFHHGETLVVQAFEYCGDCPILPSCRGDLKRARGIIPIDDAIHKWNELDRDTWLAQKESEEPPRTSLFYYDWDEKLNTGDFGFRSEFPVDLFFDFTGGGEDPTVAQFWQTIENTDYLFREFVFRHKSTGQCGEELETFCREFGIRPTTMMGDSSQMQQIRDLRAYSSFFSALRPVRKVERKIGLSLCRRRIRDNNGKRWTMVDRKCLNFINEVKNYKRRSVDPDDARDGNDHSMDAWRYRTVANYYHIGEPRMRLLSGDGEGDDAEIEKDILTEKPKQVDSTKEVDIYSHIDRVLRDED